MQLPRFKKMFMQEKVTVHTHVEEEARAREEVARARAEVYKEEWVEDEDDWVEGTREEIEWSEAHSEERGGGRFYRDEYRDDTSI